MPERPGDVPIDERVNAGEVELTYFFPGGDSGNIDAHDAITRRSPYRNRIREGRHTRRQHQSTRRDFSYAGVVEVPDYVISFPIRLEGREWEYQTYIGDNRVGLRRVFTLKNQLIELDISQTLSWLSAGRPGEDRYEELKGQLEEEASMDNVNNQLIMQLMYDRIERGDPMLPGRSKKARPERGA